MNRPRVTSIVSAALSSAAAFFVLTRSGLAGTLAGAAVASMVYTGTSHWAGEVLERVARWWTGHRGEVGAARGCPPAVAVCEDVVRRSVRRPRTVGRLAGSYVPLALGVVAIAVSGYSLVTGSPVERVIVQERIIEKPVVQQQVVVQKEIVTVTVTVPAPEGRHTTTTVAPSSSTTTTVPTTTTTTVAPPVTTTTAPPPTATTAAPPAGH